MTIESVMQKIVSSENENNFSAWAMEIRACMQTEGPDYINRKFNVAYDGSIRQISLLHLAAMRGYHQFIAWLLTQVEIKMKAEATDDRHEDQCHTPRLVLSTPLTRAVAQLDLKAFNAILSHESNHATISENEMMGCLFYFDSANTEYVAIPLFLKP